MQTDYRKPVLYALAAGLIASGAQALASDKTPPAPEKKPTPAVAYEEKSTQPTYSAQEAFRMGDFSQASKFFAQQLYGSGAGGGTSSIAQKDKKDNQAPDVSSRFFIGGEGGDGIDAKANFGWMLGLPSGNQAQFLDTRIATNFTNGFDLSAGLISRLSAGDAIWGINGYWDMMDTEDATKHQVGIGGEMLGTSIDVRVNGYLPLGGDKELTKRTPTADHYTAFMKGVDGELGFYLIQSGDINARAFIGWYYFSGGGLEDVTGPQLCLEVFNNTGITLDLEYRNDDLRGNQFSVQFRIPIPPHNRTTLRERMGERVRRLWAPTSGGILVPTGEEMPHEPPQGLPGQPWYQPK